MAPGAVRTAAWLLTDFVAVVATEMCLTRGQCDYAVVVVPRVATGQLWSAFVAPHSLAVVSVVDSGVMVRLLYRWEMGSEEYLPPSAA